MEQMSAAIKRVLAIAIAIAAAGAFGAGFTQTPTQRTIVPENMRVDINQASLDGLLKVPGMTRSWAGRVVRFRPYRSKQDLLDRGIVSGEVYNRIKDYIIAHREKQ
jgi:DNA uptake protein ComE-like DNA-binding protein